ncbi:hypothetical protein HELRODRAFT_189398 [Helobdella robusta]|uniref:BHLH domain-containing protein n=1 Tax=Helobdella robusta TaxID=6412 RepID=T1FR08_HELRO|nr:hypothetical protein HELRODRAFT_189398 [Helobdella robusta]ESN94462.1 hypothetical protein HELRODRAFT_189398 [Helobdella robusta]
MIIVDYIQKVIKYASWFDNIRKERQDEKEKVNLVNGQDEVEITFEDLDDSNAIALTLDSNGQYQFHGDSVTYRVVQVASSDEVQQLMSNLSSNQTILEGLQAGRADEVSSSSDTQPTRFTYMPTSNVQSTIETTSNATNSSKGPIYLMVAPQSTNQRSIIPRNMVKSEPVAKASRDDRRKLTHKEVERRRRDKINGWIIQLAKLIPDCSPDHPKQPDSKGGILSKACEYIAELQAENQELEESLKEFEEVKSQLVQMSDQLEELKQENQILRAHLQENGVEDLTNNE